MERREQSEAAAQERERGCGVAARCGSRAGSSEQRARALGELLVEPSELGAVEVCLLEVVADKLVFAAPLFEPAGESLMQIGARAFRDRRIRRIANERVSKT